MFERIAEPTTLAAVLRIHKDRSATTTTNAVANVGTDAGEGAGEAVGRPARVVTSASALLRTCLLRASSTDELLNGFHHVMLGAAAAAKGGGGGDGDGGKKRKEKKRPRVIAGGAVAGGDGAQTRMYQDKLFKALHTLTTTTTDGDTDGGDVGVPESVELGFYGLPLLLTLFGEASFQAAARRVAQEAHNPTVFVAGQKW